MMEQHTSRAFDIDLQDLARLVAEMGGLAEKQIGESVDALNTMTWRWHSASSRSTTRSTCSSARSRKKQS